MDKVLRTKHFSEKELQCRCGCEYSGMSKEFMDKLESIRTDPDWSKPMRLSSAYRCKSYNRAVSSTGETGPHTTSRAVDCLVSGGDAAILTSIAVKHGMTGIGWSQKGDHGSRFIHLDDLSENRPASWSY